MKIIGRDEFFKCKSGTLYCEYDPCILKKLQIKYDSMENDFLMNTLCDSIDADSSEEFVDLLSNSEKTSESIPMDFDQCGRDGCFDKKQLYAVYDKEDVKKLIEALKECL